MQKYVALTLLILSVNVTAKFYCQTKVLGKYVTPKKWRGKNVADHNTCLNFCSKTYSDLMEKEDGPRQIECYSYESRKEELIETYGDPLPERRECLTNWHATGEKFYRRLERTKSMCLDHFRSNVLYSLQRKYRETGFHVDHYFDGELIHTRKDDPICRGKMRGVRHVRNPAFSGKRGDQNSCFNDCEKMYDRYVERANGDPRQLNCYYGGKKFHQFGDLGERKSCQTINMKTGKIEYNLKLYSRGECLGDFQSNRIYMLNRKYPNELFHMNLKYTTEEGVEEIIRDYHHKVQCKFKSYGIYGYALNSSKMVTTNDDCLSFCDKRQSFNESRADGDPRWGKCYLGNKFLKKTGNEPRTSSLVEIIDKETEQRVYQTWKAKSGSIAKWWFTRAKHRAMNALNPDDEFHWNLMWDGKVVFEFDRLGICRSDYSVKAGPRGKSKWKTEEQVDCQQQCSKQLAILNSNFPNKQISYKCTFKSEEINFN